jgi:hypothetical protein
MAHEAAVGKLSASSYPLLSQDAGAAVTCRVIRRIVESELSRSILMKAGSPRSTKPFRPLPFLWTSGRSLIVCIHNMNVPIIVALQDRNSRCESNGAT